MGYTTEFFGKFKLSKLPSALIIREINRLHNMDDYEEIKKKAKKEGFPPDYFQWQLTNDFEYLEWDQGEKFYSYVEWLQYLIDRVFKPEEIELSGSVEYQGEEPDDCGIITIENGKAIKKPKSAELNETVEELKAFKDFVLKSEFGKKIIKKWNETSKHL